MKHAIVTAVLFISLFLSLGVASVLADEVANAEQIKSLSEDRRELLLYGIDSQVIELIDDLKEEKDSSLLGEVHATLKTTANPRIRTRVFDYFKSVEYVGAEDDALAVLDASDDQPAGLLLAAVGYLTVSPSPELAEHLSPLLESTDQEVIRVAVKGIGLAGNEDSVELLLDYLEDSDFPSNIKPDIILALGNLKHLSAIEPLVEILQDDGEEMIWRRYACASLGMIGDPSVLPVIEAVLYDEDANLRSYAVGALRHFETDEIVPLLMAGLKDSFWRVRVSAAQGLGEKQAEAAVPILIFKAQKDPEMIVREEAVKALGKIAVSEGFEYLRGLYENDISPPGLRFLAAEILSENDLAASLDVFRRVIEKHWDKEKSRVLERTAYYLSLSESTMLEGFYSRFLDSGELAIIIYGIRGVARNQILSLKEAVEAFASEGNNRSIRKAALAALESL
jgi:HEAT repeat protein